MKYSVVMKNNKSYILYNQIEFKISSENDVLEIISACFENNTKSIVINGDLLSEDFYNLKTKLLGTALQKFINYNIKVAFIVKKERELSDRFKELVLEINKGIDFRIVENLESAERWILS